MPKSPELRVALDWNAFCSPFPEVPMPSLRCPCDTTLRADTDDELVEKVQEHLAAEHPGREYSREEILFMAM
ncbi:hypothetical protein GCM10023066_55080 [Nocardioides kongjuensis]